MAPLPVLLLCGHLLADFVFQTRSMVEGKRTKLRWLLAHGLEVAFVQGIVLLPFCSNKAFGLLAVAAIAATHMAIDRLKVAMEQRYGRQLHWFAIDQALHLAVLAAIAAGWSRVGGAELVAEAAPELVRLALVVGIYAFNVNGGSAVVSAVLAGLQRARAAASLDPHLHAGHLIGVLERMAMLTLVWLDQWSALGFVLAAKSVARFKELEDRAFAETYLVGTLTSFLVAGASGLLLKSLVG
jgi:hypothetical protein